MNTLWRGTTYALLRSRAIPSEIRVKFINTAMINVKTRNMVKPVTCCSIANIPHVFIRHKSKKVRENAEPLLNTCYFYILLLL